MRSRFEDTATNPPESCPAPPNLDQLGAAAAAAAAGDTASSQHSQTNAAATAAPAAADDDVSTSSLPPAAAAAPPFSTASMQQLPQVVIDAIQAAHNEEQREARAAADADNAVAVAGSASAAVAVDSDWVDDPEVAVAAADGSSGRRPRQAVASYLVTTPPRRLGLRKLAQAGPFSGAWKDNYPSRTCKAGQAGCIF